MNVPKLRFKNDDGQEFPAWVNEKLGKIGPVLMCKRILKEQTKPVGDVPFYKIGTFGKEPDAYISNEVYKSFKEKYSFPKKGDILISASGTIGRTVVYDGLPAYFQDSNIVWIDNNEKELKNSFLNFLYARTTWNTENTTIARLYNDNLKSISISFPSIHEQTKIANFLSAVDEKISQLAKKHELLSQYKKGVMQKIFSQELRFKDDGSEFSEWLEYELGEVGDIVTGKTPSTTEESLWNGDIQFVTPTDITSKKYQYQTSRTVTKSLKMRVLPEKTIMFTCIASIGKMALSIKPCVTNQQINSLIPKESFDNEFIYYAILNIADYIKSTQSSSTLPIINKTEFSKFLINIPCLSEQSKIANFLSAIDEKITQAQSQLELVKQYKQGLLQQMFV